MNPVLLEYWQLAYLPEGCIFEYGDQRWCIIGRSLPIPGFILKSIEKEACPNCTAHLNKCLEKPIEFNDHGGNI